MCFITLFQHLYISRRRLRMHFRNLTKIATAALLSIALIPSTAVASDTTVPNSESLTTIKVVNSKFDESNFRIKGSMNFQYTKPSNTSKVETKENNQHVYSGTLTARILAKDLFADAYKAYKTRFEKKTIPFSNNKVSGLVMFNQDENQFPSLNYKIVLPNEYSIGSVTAQTTSKTVSSITQSTVKNTVNLTFNLGNWNDYKGFFNLYEEDAKDDNAFIQVNIPYTKNLGKQSTEPSDDYAKGSGSLDLYYHGRNPFALIMLSKDKCLFKLTIGEDKFQL